MKDTLAKDLDKFVLRLPAGLRSRIALAAAKNGRSMNAEIVQLLEEHFPPAPRMDEVLESIRAMMSAQSFAGRAAYWRMLGQEMDRMRDEIDMEKRLLEDE